MYHGTPSGRRNYTKFTTPNTTPRKQTTSVLTTPRMSINRISADLPLSVVFDDLMRHYDHYDNYGCENEFLEFIESQEACRKKWFAAEQNVIRLTTENQNLKSELARNEKKITEFREQFERRMEVVSRLESENQNYRKIILEGNDVKRMPAPAAVLSSGNGLDTISEAETTDRSSLTQTEDELECSRGGRRGRRSKRRSMEAQLHETSRKKIRTTNGTRQTVESTAGNTQQVISHTVVSISNSGGPVTAVSTLETVKSRGQPKPSAPVMTGSSETESEPQMVPNNNKNRRMTRSSMAKQRVKAQQQQIIPTESPRFGRTLSAASGSVKMHDFVEKKSYLAETCDHCGKGIKFYKAVLKCKDCKAMCHPGCKDKIPLPCVAVSTPSSNRGIRGQIGILADFTPVTHPMVPALIQHCVNEIEVRALDTVGLYRIPGAEKDVKDLKERFLKGKGVPNLSRYDPHVLCGCIKDFLRSLAEPLIGRWTWNQFSLATDIMDPVRRQSEMNQALDELPPPNQDTLAFLMLHLQRIAEEPKVLMPVGNLAKVFGPTIVGYSSYDLDGNAMLKETKKQQVILETLLAMSSDYWRRFVNRQAPAPIVPKRIYFHDSSPQPQSHSQQQTSRPKKKYFD